MPAEVGWTEREIELPGRGATFLRESVGPTGAPALLLLHGLAATGLLNWRPSLVPLARHYRVLVMDHRGHGQGMRIREPFRLADCADDAAALLDIVGLERVTAVGYSMGGPIAQLLWKRHPGRVRGLVLCATASRFADPRRRGMAYAASPLLNTLGRIAPRALLRRMAHQWIEAAIQDDSIRERVLSEVYGSDPVSISQAGAAVLRFDSSDWIGEIDVPTSILLTDRDAMVPPENQADMASRISTAVVHRVPGNHTVCVSHPGLFVPALEQACASVIDRSERRAQEGGQV